MAQNRVYNMAIEALENECFDMQDEFNPTLTPIL